jgi:hypothetical protein
MGLCSILDESMSMGWSLGDILEDMNGLAFGRSRFGDNVVLNLIFIPSAFYAVFASSSGYLRQMIAYFLACNTTIWICSLLT